MDRRIFRQVLSDNPTEVQRERDEVAGLCRLAETKLAESRHDRPEAKFAELLRVLDSSDVIRREDEKLVIFTEHKDTMDYLADRLTQMGYRWLPSTAAWTPTLGRKPNWISGAGRRSWSPPMRPAKASTCSSAAS